MSERLGEPLSRITLTIPGERRYVGIVRLLVGGIAARLDLGYETMDNLQLALERVLGEAELGSEVVLTTSIDGDAVSVLLGPLRRDPLLVDDSKPGALELERMLSALVAGAETQRHGNGTWLRLNVRIPAGSRSG